MMIVSDESCGAETGIKKTIGASAFAVLIGTAACKPTDCRYSYYQR
ncbi:MAG: hypothetical protein HMLIMOIP_002610 [Candidatus Nitrosomirales archaeon]|jgi:hypothetical protein